METDVKEMLRKLAAPFPESSVKWRTAVTGINGQGEPWVLCVPYVDAKTEIQNRFDQIVGPMNWLMDFRPGQGNSTICRISIRCGDSWVWKEGTADATEISPSKGAATQAMKLAASAWSVGRYLHRVGSLYGIVSENGIHKGGVKDKKTGQWLNFRWSPPKLPDFAMPESNLKVLTGEKAAPEKKEPVKPAAPAKPIRPPVAQSNAGISIDDVPASLRDLFAELQISDAKAIDLLKRKNYDFAEVERILNEIRLEPAAAGA